MTLVIIVLHYFVFQEDIRRLRLALLNDASEEKNLRDRVHNEVLECEGAEKDLKKLIQRKQAKLVEENLLRLRLSQAEKAIARVGGKLYTLEKQRLELEAVNSIYLFLYWSHIVID